MFAEYIKAAMDKATYEIIDDPEPFYGEIPEIQGVWASGKTLEACRDDLMSALEDWIAFRLRTGRSIPRSVEQQLPSHRSRSELSNKLTPVSRRELVRRLRKLGFDGPYPGSKHEVMAKGDISIIIPNSHRDEDIGASLITRILKQAALSRQDWLDSK